MALGKLKDKSAIGPLMQLLADENRDVHRSAIWALGELGAVEPLIEQLGNSDVRIHYSATIALAKLGDIRALNPLIILLKDEDYFIRKDVAKALGELGNRRATEPLITHLNIEERHDVRMAIIGALAKIGDQKAIGSLETHLSQVSPTLEVEENVEIGTGGAWYTHMRTEDNPEYYVTKNALKRLYKSKNGKRIGAQSSSPVKGRIVDLDAVPTDIVPAERVVINHWTAREKYALSLKKQGEGENTGGGHEGPGDGTKPDRSFLVCRACRYGRLGRFSNHVLQKYGCRFHRVGSQEV